MAKNASLHNAKREKNDEFYTRIEDIEKELAHYKDFFNGKVVFCNCDDPLESNFTKYFILNFHHLGLKKLICTFYDINGTTAYAFEYEGDDMNDDGVINEKDIEIIRQSGACRTILVDDEGFDFEKKDECWKKGIYGSGDFRSKNVIDYLKESDVVVTNPPFSLFREYVAQLIEYDKKFIIIGNGGAVSYKEIFPLIKENKMWLGNKVFSGGMDMIAGKNYDAEKCKHPKYDERGNLLINVMMCVWFTNVEHAKRNTPITLYKTYSADKYPKYDNYDAIEVDNVNRIPCDYDGVMGVPITFLDKYCPSQFELIGIDSTDFAEKIGIKPMGEEFIRRYRANGGTGHYTEGMRNLCYYENDGTPKKVYSRILIKKKVSE